MCQKVDGWNGKSEAVARDPQCASRGECGMRSSERREKARSDPSTPVGLSPRPSSTRDARLEFVILLQMQELGEIRFAYVPVNWNWRAIQLCRNICFCFGCGSSNYHGPECKREPFAVLGRRKRAA